MTVWGQITRMGKTFNRKIWMALILVVRETRAEILATFFLCCLVRTGEPGAGGNFRGASRRGPMAG